MSYEENYGEGRRRGGRQDEAEQLHQNEKECLGENEGDGVGDNEGDAMENKEKLKTKRRKTGVRQNKRKKM